MNQIESLLSAFVDKDRCGKDQIDHVYAMKHFERTTV